MWSTVNELEPTYAEVYYSPECQAYMLIMGEEEAFQYARADIMETRLLEGGVRDEPTLGRMSYAEYLAYLRTPRWCAIARRARERAGHRCMFCNAEGRLHAHHRTYERLGAELDDDVVALCADCHLTLHHRLDESRRVVGR